MIASSMLIGDHRHFPHPGAPTWPTSLSPEGVPGIRGLMAAYPETQVHLSGLAEVLLRGPSSLT